ncbi:DinB family protein [Peterkaempfera griseoplana]|uniref:DinB family protein n=1 Tax=Peterkaempfera griseoplana TaxID=66896 RepID=UPI0006E2C1D1|nr:DinB family protein [Peterkaempfera griseoplana]
MATTPGSPTPAGERGDILQILDEQRNFLRIAVRGIGDEDARRRTTVSELTLGGILRHVTRCERSWTHILVHGDGSMPEGMTDPEQYRMSDDQTLAGLLEEYAAAGRATDRAVADLPDLDRQCLLPRFPWGPQQDVHWSARRILLHIIRETAHHSGHADIVREALDGASTTLQMSEVLAGQSS